MINAKLSRRRCDATGKTYRPPVREKQTASTLSCLSFFLYSAPIDHWEPGVDSSFIHGRVLHVPNVGPLFPRFVAQASFRKNKHQLRLPRPLARLHFEQFPAKHR